MQELGRVDILVNNAGVFHVGPLESMTLEQLDETLAIHVRAAFLTAQAAARHMDGSGRIVNIGSCFAERVPYEGLTVYAMSKAALVGMSKGLARDLGSRGITVNVVHPGNTNTDMNPEAAPEAEAEREYIALGHYCEPADIAATVAALRRARRPLHHRRGHHGRRRLRGVTPRRSLPTPARNDRRCGRGEETRSRRVRGRTQAAEQAPPPLSARGSGRIPRRALGTKR